MVEIFLPSQMPLFNVKNYYRRMSFSSLPFLLYFLPISVILYWIVPTRLRKGFLIIISCLFYGLADLQFLPFILLLAFLDTIVGRLLSDKALVRLGKGVSSSGWESRLTRLSQPVNSESWVVVSNGNFQA